MLTSLDNLLVDDVAPLDTSIHAKKSATPPTRQPLQSASAMPIDMAAKMRAALGSAFSPTLRT